MTKALGQDDEGVGAGELSSDASVRYAHAENLLSQSARFLLKPEEAIDSINAIEQEVRDRWYEIARREGVSEKDCETISPAFAYEGFRLPITK